ncbi:MAG: hypothetical protein JO144_04325 [Actinobacteria bacterium]|nr:hypothetical protein [Actinomycetota bacterium]
MNEIAHLSAATDALLPRRTRRALARLDDRTSLRVAGTQAVADVNAAKADAVGFVAQRGMQNVAFLSQVEQTLGQTVPIAVSRLQAIGDLATLGIGQVVTDTVHELRRL